MKTENKILLEAFKQWLELLNHNERNAGKVWNFISYLESKSVFTLSQIKRKHIEDYYHRLKTTKSPFTGKLLKESTLNNIIRSLRLFNHYLEESGTGSLPMLLKYESENPAEREILTKKEIEKLYALTDQTVLGLRNRAILNLTYGCGLRRKEASELETEDLLLKQKLVYVRKAKNRKERYVPFTEKLHMDFLFYLEKSRPKLLDQQEEYGEQTNLLINNQGYKITPNNLSGYFRNLKKQAGIKKSGGLHILRHSIATHLMQQGMDIENIAQFLGHKTLISTQVYTHIAKKYG